jgi:phosphatidylserine decarboxylase
MTKANRLIGGKRRHGGWLPTDERALEAFRTGLADHAASRKKSALTVPVQALYDAIEGDPLLRMHLTQAIDEALTAGYELGYTDIVGLMAMIDALMTYSPPFSTTALVGCPINALLDWPMCMPAGFSFFQFPLVNARIKAVLDHWGKFLSGPDSCTYLNAANPTGWFSPDASVDVNMSMFVYDPDAKNGGYTSWNDFFTRLFKPGQRPVASPDDPAIVVSACEATPYQLQSNVALLDDFWIKTQPYSLRDMFTAPRVELAQQFVGGTVYQAFLSAYNYHRWHAPVAGTVTDAYLVPGTYYSDAPSEGLDPAGPNNSQGYITAVATRAVIVIDTGVRGLGKVACIFVGMAEISSCVLQVRAGQRLTKGEEIGFFQYGGSTHCLIFEPTAKLSFVPQPPFTEDTPIVLLSSHLATAAL